MNDITVRFLAFYNYLLKKEAVNNPSGFAKKINISSSMMNEIIKNRTNAGITLIQNTANTYPEINPEWLLTGKGDMLKKTNNNLLNEEETTLINSKHESVKDRILYIADYYNIEKSFFFEGLNTSYENFNQNIKESTLNSDIIAKIMIKYIEIDTEWLLLGIGDMLKKNNSKSECNNEVVELQRDLIKSLKNENQILQEKIERLLEDDTYRKDLQKKQG